MRDLEWLMVKRKLTREEIKSIISNMGLDLPADYMDCIGEINGGYLRDAHVHVAHFGNIPYTCNISLDKDAKGSIFVLFDKNSGYFPFASVGNGDYFAFDLKTKDIILQRHETNETIFICKSFTELLSMIEIG